MYFLGVPPLGCYNYITPRRAGLLAMAVLSCYICSLTLATAVNKQNVQEAQLSLGWPTILVISDCC